MTRIEYTILSAISCIAIGISGYSAYGQPARGADPAVCQQFNIDGTASEPLQPVTLPPASGCNSRMSNGFPRHARRHQS